MDTWDQEKPKSAWYTWIYPNPTPSKLLKLYGNPTFRNSPVLCWWPPCRWFRPRPPSWTWAMVATGMHHLWLGTKRHPPGNKKKVPCCEGIKLKHLLSFHKKAVLGPSFKFGIGWMPLDSHDNGLYLLHTCESWMVIRFPRIDSPKICDWISEKIARSDKANYIIANLDFWSSMLSFLGGASGEAWQVISTRRWINRHIYVYCLILQFYLCLPLSSKLASLLLPVLPSWLFHRHVWQALWLEAF